MVLVTFVFVALFIPVVKKMAEFIGAMDIPNARKVHKVPIPRLGGLGIYAGFLLGYMLFGVHSVQMNAILIGSFIILVTGIFDDIKPVPAKWKKKKKKKKKKNKNKKMEIACSNSRSLYSTIIWWNIIARHISIWLIYRFWYISISNNYNIYCSYN